MKIIPISGVIAGYQLDSETNVTPVTLRESLDAAGGEDILVTINSPGGSVYAGLEMFSMLRNYTGRVETRVVALAASMGSILALAGSKRTIESTAGYMIHNPINAAMGDHRALRKSADDMERMTEMFYSLYERYTSMSRKQAKAYMDAETYFYGADVAALGFDVVDVGGEPDPTVGLMTAKALVRSIKEKISIEESAQDLEKAAAFVTFDKKTFTQDNARASGETMEAAHMDLAILKAQHPDVYAAVVQEERDRVVAHLIMGEKTGAMETAVAAIKAGHGMTQTLTAEYLSAGLDRRDITAAAADGAAAAAAADGAATDDKQDLSKLFNLAADQCGVDLGV